MPTKVLISGAGIAGIVLAHYLPRPKFEVTIVEKAAAMRTSGQAVEISAPAAKEVARQMGIEQLIKSKSTTEEGLKFVNRRGGVILQDEIDRVHGRSFTSEDEILRSDLAQILYDTTKTNTRYIFDDCVASIQQDNDAVDITFESGRKESFDHLIICDGLYSKTRTLAGFEKDELDIRPFNIATAFFTIENKTIDMKDKYCKWYIMSQGRHMMTRPDATGRNTRAYFSCAIDAPLDRSMTVKEQKALVRQRCTGGEYVVDEVLDGMDASADDFYMSEIAQMRCKTWSHGRVALCGDAAYCPSPFSGAGVDCALIGAYVLAKELATQQDYRQAYIQYEKRVRPFIDDAQAVSPTVINLLYPKSTWGVTVIHTILWLIWKSRILSISKMIPNFGFFASESYKLPEYNQ